MNREETIEPKDCPLPSDGHCWHWRRGYQLLQQGCQLPLYPSIDVDEYKCCWCGGKKVVKYRQSFQGMMSDKGHGNHV